MLKKLDLPEATFTHIFVTFGIFVMPNAIPALMKSLKPGGFFGITTWRSLAWQPILDTSISKMKNKPPHVSASEVLNTMYSGRDWGSSEYLEQQFREAGCEKIETEQRVITAKVGTPKLVTETMQFPLKMITSVWKDDKKDEWLKELNEVMSKEVTEMAGGDGQVEMTFEGLVAWGYKK